MLNKSYAVCVSLAIGAYIDCVEFPELFETMQ